MRLGLAHLGAPSRSTFDFLFIVGNFSFAHALVIFVLVVVLLVMRCPAVADGLKSHVPGLTVAFLEVPAAGHILRSILPFGSRPLLGAEIGHLHLAEHRDAISL